MTMRAGTWAEERDQRRAAKVAELSAKDRKRMQLEREQLIDALAKSEHSHVRAATMLGITVKVLTARLAKHRLAARRAIG